jgi:hypothetical protein
MTKYPMPDSVVKQVKKFAHGAAGTFDFADRNEVLFEWNEEFNDDKGLVEEDPIVAYPLLVAEFPGITLEGDIPMPSIEDNIKPQGCAEGAAAQNVNLAPFAIAGVEGPNIIDTNNNQISKYDNDKNDNIIAVADVQQANALHKPQPIVKVHNNDSLDNNVADDYPNGYDDNNDNDNDSVASINVNPNMLANAAAPNVTDELDSNEVSGVCRSKHKNKGMTNRFSEYGMLMMTRQEARGGLRQATICNGTMFFTAKNLSNTKPIPVEDHNDWVLGMVLVQY